MSLQEALQAANIKLWKAVNLVHILIGRLYLCSCEPLLWRFWRDRYVHEVLKHECIFNLQLQGMLDKHSYCELVLLSGGQCSTQLPWCAWVQSRYCSKFNISKENQKRLTGNVTAAIKITTCESCSRFNTWPNGGWGTPIRFVCSR